MNELQRSIDKWGEAGKGGFQLLPDILLKKQVELGLSATDMLVLINITMHWWFADQRPFPRSTTIAARMGLDPRTVQRSLKKLTDLDLVHRISEPAQDGTDRIVCDLSGLVARLAQYVARDPDYLTRQNRKAVQESGGSAVATLAL